MSCQCTALLQAVLYNNIFAVADADTDKNGHIMDAGAHEGEISGYNAAGRTVQRDGRSARKGEEAVL